MAVTQYIGARYVPKFYEGSNGTDWTANTQYEPLTIVTRNGNSYTSKKAVPSSVGAPEDNPAYWASTGIYNQQVEEYRQEVISLSENVEDYREDMNDYIKGAQSLANRKFLFIGDSYAEGYNPDGNVTGWCEICASNLHLSNSQYDITYKGGAGFVANTQGKNFYDLLDDATGTDYTDIVVCGGYNDNTATENAAVSAINAFMTLARSKYPNARVYIGHIGWSKNPAKIYDLAKSVRNYIHGATASGAVYIVNSESACRNYTTDFASDGIHLTSTGENDAAQAITNGILGYSVDKLVPFASGTFTPIADISTNNLSQIAFTLHNGIVTISSAAVINLNFPTAHDFGAATGSNLVEIADIASALAVGSAYNNLSIPVQCTVQNEGSYINCAGRLVFKNAKLYLALMHANAAGTGWQNFNSVTYVYINGFSAAFDSTFC